MREGRGKGKGSGWRQQKKKERCEEGLICMKVRKGKESKQAGACRGEQMHTGSSR